MAILFINVKVWIILDNGKGKEDIMNFTNYMKNLNRDGLVSQYLAYLLKKQLVIKK
jgi:hypothetical protein